MASESIGSVYPTQIPGYDDAADIQAALKLYHYGSTTAPANEGALIANSVAGHIKALDTRLDLVEEIGVGSIYSSTEPTSIQDGFVWMDADDTLGSIPGSVAAYQISEPLNPVIGLLWIDSTNPNTLSLKVYDGTSWKVIV